MIIEITDIVVTELCRQLKLLETIFLCSYVLEYYRASRGKPKFNSRRTTGSKLSGWLSPNFIVPCALFPIMNTNKGGSVPHNPSK